MTLSLEGVRVTRGKRTILGPVTMSAEAGYLTALCGANGAGKTTALRVLSGALSPDSGNAALEGRPLQQWSRGDLARRRAAVAQTATLGFPFLVHEVVEMGRTPHQGRVPRALDEEAVHGAMTAMAVSGLAERDYLTLSGGERQRVMIARALAQVWHAPDEGDRWLLLDEPTSALDLKHQLALVALLERLAGEGWGILAVLHDLPLVARHADAVVMFKDARVMATGAPAAVLTPEGVADAFGLDAPYAVA